MDATNLIAYLPFDTSTTEDKCGNTWTTSGTPVIEDSALKLDGSSYLQLNGSLTLGGQDFTICGRARMDSSAQGWGGLFSLNKNNLRIIRYQTLNNAVEIGYKRNLARINLPFALTSQFFFEIDYQHSTGKWFTFFNGTLVHSYTNALERTTYSNVFVGHNGDNNTTAVYWGGTIDEFMIYDGVALHTENFTPPTDADYAELKFALGATTVAVGYTFDVERTAINAQFFGTQWVQPVLTANGEIGVDEFAVASSADTANAYKAFDSSATSYVNKMNAGEWLEFYSKTPIRIFDITLTSTGGLPAQGIFQISYDGGETWTQVGTWTDSDSEGKSAKVIWDSDYPAGQYFRLLSQARSIPHPSNNADFCNVVITAWNALDSPNFETQIFYTFDVERRVKNAPLTWRYENAGIAENLLVNGTTLVNLPESQSKTTVAFIQTQRTKCFDLPATNEVWMKFDVYFDGSNRWQAYNVGTTGITAQTDGRLSFFSNDGNVGEFSGICKKNQLQTVLLYMVSGSTDGVIEAWIDGNFIYRYTGDVNHGEDFADLYLQSDGGNTFFSNVIISNAEIGTDENAPADFFEFTRLFDVERRVTNTPNINEDTPPQISFSGSNNNYATLPEDVLPGATEFTIEAKFSTTSTKNRTDNFEWGTIAGRELGGNWQNDFGLCVNDGKLCFWAEPSRNGSNSTRNTTSDAIVNDGQIHTAAVRSNADGSIDLFCDGEIVAHTDNVNAKTPDTKNILVASNSNGYSALQMNLYEVRFWNTAREEIFADIDGTEENLQGWYIPTENGLTDYSPNIRNATVTGTVSYSEVNTVFVDVDYESTNDALGWRYEDCAVYFGTGAPINFHVPPTAEIWVRFDVYFDGVSRWYAYDDGIYGMTGITAQTSLELDFLSAGSAVKTLPDICKTKVTQTYLLHMISGVADGLIEVWCGLEKIGTYTGNVNNGRLFADFKLRSDDIGTSFTELIISNSELQPDEKPANTVRATKTSQLNTCNTKTKKIWLDRGGDYPFPYLDLTTREVLRQLITETIEGEGEFSPITTIWLKFDVYFDGINRWSAYNDSETNGKSGVFSDLPLDFSFFANDLEVARGQSALIANRWQTVIVHMESAEAPNGMIDVWIDGVQMHQYLGNVNNGEEFTNIYLTSEGGGTMFKNFIASSAPLTEDDTPQTVATGMGQLAFTVWHNGKVLTVPLKLSAVPIEPALAVRWQGCDWYNPLVLPSAENASEVAVRYNGAIYALSYF